MGVDSAGAKTDKLDFDRLSGGHGGMCDEFINVSLG